MTGKPRTRTPKARQRIETKALSVAAFLKTADPASRARKCQTCKDPALVAMVDEFAALKRAGKAKPWQSWSWFHREFVVREHGIEIRYVTLMNHVRNCLGSNP